MRPRHRRGFTLIEILIASLIMVLLGAGLWTLLRSSYDSQYEILGQNAANATARQGIDTLADNLRGAVGLTAAGGSDVTYTDNSGNNIRYWQSGTNLLKTVNGLPSGGATVVTGLHALIFSYGTYANGAWQYTSAPSTPASVGAVNFTAVITINDATRQMSGSVRIRQIRYQ